MMPTDDVDATSRSLARVAIIGTSCSGKSTLAAELSRLLGAPHHDLDELHWGPQWTPRPFAEFERLVAEATAEERWITAGNYGRVQGMLLTRATTVIWLNYDFATVLWRALRRTVRRVATREELWHGNRESFRRSFWSRDSILLWVAGTFGARRRRCQALRAAATYPHLAWIEFRRPREARRFLRRLQQIAN